MDDDKGGIEQQHTRRDVRILTINHIFLLLVLSSLLFAGNGWGATYYVDQTGGNNANPGTSTGNAWKTVAKVNSSSFFPGDSILFKRGEVWRDAALVVPSSGSAGNPITFGAYGTGANPVINGANIFTSWTQEDQGGWYAYWVTSTVNPYIVMQNDTRLQKSATKAGMTPGTHWWDSGNNRVYIRTTGNDNPSGYKMQVAQRPSRAGLIQYNGKSYITIDGIDAIYSRDACIHNYPFSAGQTNLVAKNLTTSYSAGGQITFGSDTQWVKNITVENVRISEANTLNPGGNEAVTFQYSDGCELKNSIIHDFYQEAVDMKNHTKNCKIHNNHIYNRKSDASYTGPAVYVDGADGNIEIYNNKIHAINPSYWGMAIHTNDEVGGRILGNLLIHNNEIYDCYEGINIACADSSDVANINIYNNDIAGMMYGLTFNEHLLNNLSGTNNVKNNIFWLNRTDIRDMTTGNYAIANLTISHNLFKTGYSSSTIGTYSVVTSTSPFKDYGNFDFTLVAGSPAIDTGTYVGLTSDFLGNIIPSGAAPDIGAYEYGSLPTLISLPSAPANLSATPASPSQITLSWTDQSTNETGFLIERKTGAGGTYTQIGTAAADATTYSNSGLAEGTTYFYRVRAVSGAGNSAYSNEASATTQGSLSPKIPSPPAGIVISP